MSGLIEVTELIEHEDGSATIKIDTEPEATRLLLEIGFRTLLKKAIDAENDEYKIEAVNEKGSTESTEEIGVD